MRIGATTFVAALLLACPSRAQQVVPPGAMRVDGYPIACGMAPTILMPALNDIALWNGQAILIHWPQFRLMPTAVKAFIYAHECGHSLGLGEDDADAFAIRLGRQQGWINGPILGQICGAVIMSPGDWTHFPGPVRCQRMLAVFQSG